MTCLRKLFVLSKEKLNYVFLFLVVDIKNMSVDLHQTAKEQIEDVVRERV